MALETPEAIAAEVAGRNYIGTFKNSQSVGGDGFRRAIGEQAIHAYRLALLKHFQNEVVDALEEIERSTGGDDLEDIPLDDVFAARDRASDVLSSILATLSGQENYQPTTKEN